MREPMLEPRSGTEQEWSRLMRLALDGDQIAYRTLLSAIAPHVRARARRGLARAGRGPAEVEDVVQETLLAVHLKRASWDRTLAFTPWLNALARYKTIDMLRRLGTRGEVELDDEAEAVPVQEERGDLHIDAHRMLATLDGRQRQIVEQVAMVGRGAAEVGADLGMSEGAVRVALHRALKRLAQTFQGARDAN